MSNATSLLFDLPGFTVVECVEDAAGDRTLLIVE